MWLVTGLHCVIHSREAHSLEMLIELQYHEVGPINLEDYPCKLASRSKCRRYASRRGRRQSIEGLAPFSGREDCYGGEQRSLACIR